MTTISALPEPPQTSDPANFDAKADALIAALSTFITETNLVAGEVIVNRDESILQSASAASRVTAAAASAAAALISENNAASITGAPKWNSGQSYVIGNTVWSPATGYIYRNKVATSSTTDPSALLSNWTLISTPLPDQTAQDGKYLASSGGVAVWRNVSGRVYFAMGAN